MSLKRTQQLMKALALDFLHQKQLNMGVLQLLCEQQKVHASTTDKQVIEKVSVIDKGFQLLKEQILEKIKSKKVNNKKYVSSSNVMQRNLHNMMSAFLFNVSAINEHYIQEVENEMIESTASQSFKSNEMMNKTIYKDKMGVNLLKEQLQKYFHYFIDKSVYLKTLVEELSQKEERQFRQGELGLLETVDYLCVKYSVNNRTAKKVVQVLEKHQPNAEEQNVSQFHFSQNAKYINQLLFHQSQQQQLFNILQTNPNVSFKHILLLISANYLSNNKKRKIFSNASRQGKEVIQMFMVKTIKRVGKLELFTEKNQEYGPFRLILMHLLNKHFPVYWQFSQIVKSALESTQPLASDTNLNWMKKIEQFFRVYVTLEHPHFQQLFKFTYGILANRYSEPVAMELVKKLLLNRFLLNPAFFILYHDPTEGDIKKFIESANIIRTLFYPNKTQELASKLGNHQLIKISADIIHSLQYCLNKQKDSKLFINTQNFLYVNDKIIKSTMLQLYEDINDSQKVTTLTQKDNKSPNIVSDYSLSFSIVKNQNLTRNILSRPNIENVSEVRLSQNTNRTNLKDNQSIRYMYDQLKEQKSRTEMPPKSPQKKPVQINNQQTKQDKQKLQNPSSLRNVSELARKQHEITNQTRLNTLNLPTDREMIEQLVELRKQYGHRKKQIKNQYEARRIKSLKRITVLSSFSIKFNQFKEEIQKDNDTLYVHMTSIA